MYLRNVETGDEFMIAKYYPSTGWFPPLPFHVTREQPNLSKEQVVDGKVKFYDSLIEWLDQFQVDDCLNNGANYILLYEDDPTGKAVLTDSKVPLRNQIGPAKNMVMSVIEKAVAAK